MFRLAGAGCLGYATAEVASLFAPGYGRVRVQNLAAITFNLVAAIAAGVALAQGTRGLLAPVVAAAATFFTLALIVLDVRLSG